MINFTSQVTLQPRVKEDGKSDPNTSTHPIVVDEDSEKEVDKIDIPIPSSIRK